MTLLQTSLAWNSRYGNFATAGGAISREVGLSSGEIPPIPSHCSDRRRATKPNPPPIVLRVVPVKARGGAERMKGMGRPRA